MYERSLAFASQTQRDAVYTALSEYSEDTTHLSSVEYDAVSALWQHLSFTVDAEAESEPPQLELTVVFESMQAYETCVKTLKSTNDPNLNWLGYRLANPETESIGEDDNRQSVILRRPRHDQMEV